ncbi:hypothetical protein GGD83_005091, partial [Rhodoblastus sphagnicola]|nr:hypothetical protein [Rhodoblastus sphagnicola]
MTSMAQFSTSKFCSSPPPTSSWRRAAASKMPARTRSGLPVLGKIP